MRHAVLLLFLSVSVLQLPSQTVDEEFRIYTEQPRLFLRPQRLRLLRRERDRKSMRWEQYQTLITSGAPMPEKGLALALYYQVTGEASYGKQAIEWAVNPTADARQTALVLDWCQPLMTESQTRTIATRLQRWLAQSSSASDLETVRTRVLATVALADQGADHGEAILRPLIEKWWRGDMAPSLNTGRKSLQPEGLFALFELLHVIRDNLSIDLRDSAHAYFKQLVPHHLLSYYPAPYPTTDTLYRIPAFFGAGDPDLRRAALSRIAGLEIVSYDTNSVDSQYLQGWLMHDAFILRDMFGSPYEFLWANPYQPGLSYYNYPSALHDPLSGDVFARSGWDDDTTWIGYVDHRLQIFDDGKIRNINVGSASDPMYVGNAMFLAGKVPIRFRVEEKEAITVFLLGLRPLETYDVEVDDEEMAEYAADRNGTLVLEFPENTNTGVRVVERMGVTTSR